MRALSREKGTAEKALLAAGEAVRDSRSRAIEISYKSSKDPVTDIDIESERIILGILRAEFPDDSYLCEESGARTGSSRRRWIVDPIDGTANFMRGLPWTCVSIGLEEGGVLVLGAIYNPFLDELFVAERGAGASLNGERIRVSRVADPAKALVTAGVGPSFWKNASVIDELKAIGDQVQDLRIFNSGALDLAYIAAGRIDAYWELESKPWDVAAGILLVEEAGGKISDFAGRPFKLDESRIVASNGRIHEKLVGQLQNII